jgi:hypothetical protein
LPRGGLTTHSTGARVSDPLIVECVVAALCARPVNSGVTSPLRMDSILSRAAPQLKDIQLAWIMREVG